jgi:hypothetical protein
LAAIRPAIGGKKKVLANRTRVNLHPSRPTSMGSLATAHSDQEVRKATVVANPAPDRKSAATMGRLT